MITSHMAAFYQNMNRCGIEDGRFIWDQYWLIAGGAKGIQIHDAALVSWSFADSETR